MISNFVIHDSVSRPQVARAPFLVLAAAPRNLPRHPARLICRWTIRSRHGRLVGQLDRGHRLPKYQAGHCSWPKAVADIAAMVCFGISKRIAGGLNRGGPIERRP